MRGAKSIFVFAMIIGFGVSNSVFVQEPSLVDLARKERARKSAQAQGENLHERGCDL